MSKFLSNIKNSISNAIFAIESKLKGLNFFSYERKSLFGNTHRRLTAFGHITMIIATLPCLAYGVVKGTLSTIKGETVDCDIKASVQVKDFKVNTGIGRERIMEQARANVNAVFAPIMEKLKASEIKGSTTAKKKADAEKTPKQKMQAQLEQMEITTEAEIRDIQNKTATATLIAASDYDTDGKNLTPSMIEKMEEAYNKHVAKLNTIAKEKIAKLRTKLENARKAFADLHGAVA